MMAPRWRSMFPGHTKWFQGPVLDLGEVAQGSKPVCISFAIDGLYVHEVFDVRSLDGSPFSITSL